MKNNLSRNDLRKKRHLRMKRKLRGTAARPRVSIFRSLNNIFLQGIDDSSGRTVCSASTMMKEFKDKNLPQSDNIEAAKQLGSIFAQKLKENNSEAVVFDRSGYKYHGKVKAVVEALREASIKV